MTTKQSSDVDAWLEREADHVRKALESASRHFDGNDNLTVTLWKRCMQEKAALACLSKWENVALLSQPVIFNFLQIPLGDTV